MKKLLSVFFVFTALLFLTQGAKADECELDLSFTSEATAKAPIEFTVNYSVPHDKEGDAKLKLILSGIDDVKISEARTLVCDDSSCNLHEEADFLQFNNNTVALKTGYSGSITFKGTVLNVKSIKVTAKLSGDAIGAISKSVSADVQGYTAPNNSQPQTPPEITPAKTGEKA